MKKILLYGWGGLGERYLQKSLEKCGYKVAVYQGKAKNYDLDARLSMELLLLLEREKPDFIFSMDYFPFLSSIAGTRVLPYISWVYDAPHHTLYSETVHYRGNYIFVFDREQHRQLIKRGLTRVFYLPLGTAADFFEKTMCAALPDEKKAYQADISFVGRLYADSHNYYDKLQHLEEEEKRLLREIVEKQKFCYTHCIIHEALQGREELIGDVMREAGLFLDNKYESRPEEMVAAVLGKKVTVEERRELLEAIAARFALTVYSDSDTSGLMGITKRGYIDYETQMPLAFHESRINLNITLRTIESGIPLRALDIMASGGFLLSNYQPELAEYFIEGEELALFYSKEDCLAKIAYYLSHEEEREKIARKGCEKVKQLFLQSTQCSKMMKRVDCVEEKVNLLLAAGEERAYERLHALCRTQKFTDAVRDTQMAQMIILDSAYEMEVKNGFFPTVFHNFTSLAEADAYFTALKFYLHRIEFELPESMQREMLYFLKDTVTSRFTLMLTANQTVYHNKAQIAAKLAGYLAELGRTQDLMPLLVWGMPGEAGKELLRQLTGEHG